MTCDVSLICDYIIPDTPCRDQTHFDVSLIFTIGQNKGGKWKNNHSQRCNHFAWCQQGNRRKYKTDI